MPTERFYRLPKEKQTAIRDAARKEFISVSIDKVSINKIIQAVGISRGSFYTYFEDKWDILEYLYEDGRRKMKEFCIGALKRHDGDVWLMLEDLLEEMLKFCARDDGFTLLKGMMQHMGPAQMLESFSSGHKNCEKAEHEFHRWCYEKADLSSFKDQSYETFHLFLTMAAPAMAFAVRSFYSGEDQEKVKKEYCERLHLLQYGACMEQPLGIQEDK